jgi:hypothetical protein
LIKKLKLKKEALHVLLNALIEAQLAFDFQQRDQLPVIIDEKLGQVHELLTLADERTFNKEELENAIAFLKDMPQQELTEASE